MKHIHFVLAAGAVATTVAFAAAPAMAKTNLKISYWVPPTHLLTPGYKEWGESIKKATNGSITYTLYPSSQLGSGRDHYDMVKRGIADMGLINPGYTPGRFPVIGATDLPFTISDSLKAAPAITRWYAKYEAKEMPEHYVCHMFTHDIGALHTTKKQVKVPADVQGLNIRSANQTMSRFITGIGGNPVQVPIMEAKDTLDKGITDGITVTIGGMSKNSTFFFGEVVHHTLDMPLYVSTFEHGINKKKYDGLSASERRVIDDHCTPEWSAKIYRYWYEDDVSDQKDARANLKDHKWYKPTPEEAKLWRKAAEPVVAEWAASVKKVGLDPDKVLKELHDELKKADALF